MNYILVLLSLLGTTAFAESRYDYRTGNYYTVTPTYGGGARVQGMNIKNGTTWSNTVDQRGNQRGYDANGNYYNYNADTGTYMNFGTGKTCTGKGAYRVCN